jgi:DNA-binding MarR family transcriptional regulator
MSEQTPGLHEALMRHTGYLLARAGAAGQRQFAQRLEQLGLTPRSWGAMNVLDHEGPLTQQALGRLTLTDPSTMVATIDELESGGLVQRRPHPTDRRAHQLHITEAGHDTLRQGRELARQAQAELLSPLDGDERKQLHDMLRRVVEHAGAAPPWFRTPSG